jgi:short-subunit dehydrogenase
MNRTRRIRKAANRAARKGVEAGMTAVTGTEFVHGTRSTMHRLKWLAMGGAALGTAAGVTAGLAAGVTALTVARRLRGGLELRGKNVLITGSSRGLGLALARQFAAQSCNVVICARDSEELNRAAEDLRRSGANVLAVVCDVTKREQVDRMVQEASDRFGAIDILVNNAGVITVGPVQTQTIEDFEEAMRVMFWGVVYPTLAVLPQMLARRSGRIANITSIGGKVAVPHLLPYACAKFAAVGFSEGLHAEVGRYGIKVTTVCPGLMRTGSYVNASFKGNNQAEYSWFSLGSTLPLVSIAAQRAAAKIVRAIRQGRSELIITPQARLLATAHGIAPGLVSDALSFVNRLLPNATDDHSRHLGKESKTAISESPLTALGRRAAREFNETPEGRTALQTQTV